MQSVNTVIAMIVAWPCGLCQVLKVCQRSSSSCPVRTTCRPDLNMERLYKSSRRLLLADYDPGLALVLMLVVTALSEHGVETVRYWRSRWHGWEELQLGQGGMLPSDLLSWANERQSLLGRTPEHLGGASPAEEPFRYSWFLFQRGSGHFLHQGRCFTLPILCSHR